jgi:hypothetical protein
MIKRIGWIVFVVALIALILVGAYRTIQHEEARPPAPHTAPYR